jgi:probable phosphoglycerate mutase
LSITRALLIRHGETEWNREARIQGQLDVPLNEAGRAQARRLAERLRDEGIEAAYSSDLARVYETAEIALAGSGLPIHRLVDLREISFGAWQGKRWAEVEREFPQEVLHYRQSEGRYAPPGGESLTDLRRRAVAAFQRIVGDHRGQTVALFSHGGPCRAILSEVLGIDAVRGRRFGMSNASVHVVEVDEGEARIVLLNDTGHLKGTAAPLSVFEARRGDG